TVIQGNLIGTDATGFKPLGSGSDGIELFGSFNVISNNVIAANAARGILLTQNHDNLVQDNFIGTDITGTNFLGNAAEGVLAFNCFSNTIRANVIAGNQGAGVSANANFGAVSNISVLGNSIFANGGLGIDLVSGANNSQTNPVLTNVLAASNAVVIQGFLASVPNTTYRVEFFANSGCDPSGFGEGQTFLGA